MTATMSSRFACDTLASVIMTMNIHIKQIKADTL